MKELSRRKTRKMKKLTNERIATIKNMDYAIEVRAANEGIPTGIQLAIQMFDKALNECNAIDDLIVKLLGEDGWKNWMDNEWQSVKL